MRLYGAETAAVLKSTKSEDFYQRALLVLYRDSVVGEKLHVRNSFSTDGVGTSLYTRTWKSRPNAAKNPESAGEKATRLADVAAKAAAAAANRQWTLDDFDREFVVIGLGRKTALAAKRLGNPGWEYSLSTDEYYELCGYNDYTLKIDRRIDGIDGLREWMSKTPTPRTANSQETLDYLRYLYRSEYFRKHISLNLDIHTRIDRWSTYKQQQAAIAHICHCLTEGLDRERATLCFGSATFSTSSRGHMASPSMRQLVDYLRQDGWHVITVWEFNTSQVCSRCHHELESGELPYKLCNVGSSADGHAFRYKPANNHFVKRCTICRTTWNRDFNAALNIAYLGMLQYYQRQRP
ncbi:hypothetical protein LPJ60_003759, partial [Coemansia sp. RSA 2675]